MDTVVSDGVQECPMKFFLTSILCYRRFGGNVASVDDCMVGTDYESAFHKIDLSSD